MTRKITGIMLIVLFIISGCMSAQQIRNKRIEQNQDVFNSYSPEIKEKINLGQLDLGFNQEMTRMTWGNPDRVYTRLIKEGLLTIWVYTFIQTQTRSQYVSIPVYVTDKQGKRNTRYKRILIDHGSSKEYPIARVEFDSEGVSAIEFLEDQHNSP